MTLIVVVGERFGEWTILAEGPRQGAQNQRSVLAKCVCGVERIISLNDLRRGKTTCCGCQKRTPVLGFQYGKWTITGEKTTDSHRHRVVICACECGAIKEVQLNNLRSGASTSCGCTHFRGAKGTGHYTSWVRAKTRGVCDLWSTWDGFAANPPQATCPFTGEIRSEWFEGAHLARTADLGEYCPENCRWATPEENQRERNERTMLRLDDGRFMADVAACNGLAPGTWYRRYCLGWDKEKSVTQSTERGT